MKKTFNIGQIDITSSDISSSNPLRDAQDLSIWFNNDDINSSYIIFSVPEGIDIDAYNVNINWRLTNQETRVQETGITKNNDGTVEVKVPSEVINGNKGKAYFSISLINEANEKVNTCAYLVLIVDGIADSEVIGDKQIISVKNTEMLNGKTYDELVEAVGQDLFIPSIEGLASEEYVNSQLEPYITSEEVDELAKVLVTETEFNETVETLATKQEVETAIATATEGVVHEEDIANFIDNTELSLILESELNPLNNSIDALKAKQTTDEASIEANKANIEANKASISSNKSQIDTLKGTVEVVSNQAASAAQAAATSSGIAQALQNEVDDLEVKVETIDAASKQNKANIEALNSDMATMAEAVNAEIEEVKGQFNEIDYSALTNKPITIINTTEVVKTSNLSRGLYLITSAPELNMFESYRVMPVPKNTLVNVIMGNAAIAYVYNEIIYADDSRERAPKIIKPYEIVTESQISNFATNEQIANFATVEQVDSKISAKEQEIDSQIDTLATSMANLSTNVDNKLTQTTNSVYQYVSDKVASIPTTYLGNYDTKETVDLKIAAAIANIDIPAGGGSDLTEARVIELIQANASSVDLTNYYTKNEIETTYLTIEEGRRMIEEKGQVESYKPSYAEYEALLSENFYKLKRKNTNAFCFENFGNNAYMYYRYMIQMGDKFIAYKDSNNSSSPRGFQIFTVAETGALIDCGFIENGWIGLSIPNNSQNIRMLTVPNTNAFIICYYNSSNVTKLAVFNFNSTDNSIVLGTELTIESGVYLYINSRNSITVSPDFSRVLLTLNRTNNSYKDLISVDIIKTGELYTLDNMVRYSSLIDTNQWVQQVKFIDNTNFIAFTNNDRLYLSAIEPELAAINNISYVARNGFHLDNIVDNYVFLAGGNSFCEAFKFNLTENVIVRLCGMYDGNSNSQIPLYKYHGRDFVGGNANNIVRTVASKSGNLIKFQVIEGSTSTSEAGVIAFNTDTEVFEYFMSNTSYNLRMHHEWIKDSVTGLYLGNVDGGIYVYEELPTTPLVVRINGQILSTVLYNRLDEDNKIIPK